MALNPTFVVSRAEINLISLMSRLVAIIDPVFVNEFTIDAISLTSVLATLAVY